MRLISANFDEMADPAGKTPIHALIDAELLEKTLQLPSELRDALFAKARVEPSGLSITELSRARGVSRQQLYNRANRALAILRNHFDTE